MKQNFIRCLVAAVLLGVCSLANAKFKVGDLFYNIIDSENKYVEVTYEYYLDTLTAVYYPPSNYLEVDRIEIPETVTYNGTEYTVTKIGDDAFRYACYYSSDYNSDVILPKTITEIGKNAFYQCFQTWLTLPSSLTTLGEYSLAGSQFSYIELTESITTIGDYAFYGANFGTFEIPETVLSIGKGAFCCASFSNNNITLPSHLSTIPEKMFEGCYITSVNIPDNITSIGTKAFYGCNSLKKVYNQSSLTLEKGGTTNGYVAYYAVAVINEDVYRDGNYSIYKKGGKKYIVDYHGSATNITIANGYEIGDGAFYRSNVQKVVLPTTLTYLGEGAFYGSKITTIDIPETVTHYGSDIFAYSSISGVTLPSSMTRIPDHMFERCSSLTKIELPSNLQEIGISAFEYSKLSNVTLPSTLKKICKKGFSDCKIKMICLPKNLTTIEEGAFSGCTYLKKVINLSSLQIEQGQKSNGYVAYYALLLVNADQVSKTGDFYYYVKNSKKYIYDYDGFAYNLSIPSGYQIANSAFYGNEAIVWVNFRNNLDEIGAYAFAYCPNLRSVDFNDYKVNTIGEWAFSKCPNLSTITIPKGLQVVPKYMCFDCPKLSYVYSWNRTFTKIEESAFRSCSNLSTIHLPTTLQVIEREAFAECPLITECTLPSSLKKLGGGSYRGTGIKKIAIPSQIDSIQYGCFSESKLESVTLPSGLKFIGGNAFYDCNISEITLPQGLKTIDYDAFNGCKNLTHISIPSSVTIIDEGAFYDCESLTDIEINANPELQIERLAFGNIPSAMRVVLRGDEIVDNCDSEAFIYYLLEDEIWERIEENRYTDNMTLYVDASLINDYKYESPWNSFGTIKPLGDLSVFDDDHDYMCNLTTDDVPALSYTRDFKNTYWQSLYLPFSLNYEDWADHFEIAYINGFRQVDVDEDGTVDETYMDIVKIRNGSLRANYPYLIKAKETGEQTLSTEHTTLYPTESNSIECSTMFQNYRVTGTTCKINTKDITEKNLYGLSSNSLHPLGNNVTISPFRWYLSITQRDDAAYNVSSPQQIRVRVFGEEDADGITELHEDGEEEVITFDLNGRIIEPEQNGKPGFYVRNGRKIIIK